MIRALSEGFSLVRLAAITDRCPDNGGWFYLWGL